GRRGRCGLAYAAGVSSARLPLAAQLLGLGADRLGPGVDFGGLAAVLGGAVPVFAGRRPVAACPFQVLHRHEVAAADLAGGVDGECQAGEGHGEGDERQGHVISSGACARRFAAASAYRSLISMPIALRPRLRAATRVEPDPANGSATTPGGHAAMSVSMRPTGFGVGWFALSAPRGAGHEMTVPRAS